jgi:UDP-N-acetylmuramoylalanine--D-glutamate ligase
MINLKEKPVNLQNLSVTVLGAKRSGIAAAILAARRGASVRLSDIGNVEISAELQAALQKHNIQIETGGHSDLIYKSDLVVLSPGIPNAAPVVREINQRHIPVVAEVEMAYWFCPTDNIIAVTVQTEKPRRRRSWPRFSKVRNTNPTAAATSELPSAI